MAQAHWLHPIEERENDHMADRKRHRRDITVSTLSHPGCLPRRGVKTAGGNSAVGTKDANVLEIALLSERSVALGALVRPFPHPVGPLVVRVNAACKERRAKIRV